jgi:hypothetical protein
MNKFPIILVIFLFLTSLIAGCTTTTQDSKKNIANDLAAQIKLTGPLDSSIFDDYSKFQEWVGHINTVIRIMNEKIHTKLSEIDSTPSGYDNFKTLMKYSPLIGSYNDLYNSAVALPSENDLDYTNFYVNLTKFSFDFAVLQSQLSYHIAYSATGEIVSTFGLDELAPYVGDTAFSAFESGIHWTFRGAIDNQTNNLINYVGNQVSNSTILKF